ncbi:MAG: ATP-binding cassette domain-containing protein [Candidatus Methanomethylicaceae archaeon]
MGMKEPFLTLENITLRVQQRILFQDSFWRIHSDEHWAILGPNGSGKSTLVRSLWGGVLLQNGRILYHFLDSHPESRMNSINEFIGYVSFETHQRLIEHEERQEELRTFANKKDEITTTKDILLSGIMGNRPVTQEDEKRCVAIANTLNLQSLLSQSITSLSTGEMRKLLIGRALMKSPKLLILDEPFDGLDEPSQKSLATLIHHLMETELRIILVVHRLEEILPRITHVLLIKEGQFFMRGPKEIVLTSENLSEIYGYPLFLEKYQGRYRATPILKDKESLPYTLAFQDNSSKVPEVLIEMKDTTVHYNGRIVLDRLNWVMRRGENWAILGPNGSGKSTIVKLILGENLQGYSNQITLLGKKKGSGETLWEIKKWIGAVSSELQIQYRKKMSAYDVIASGFYDSIGLYQYPSPKEKAIVNQWIELLNLEEISKMPFHQLSYGQKRMILIARAMVKSPILLILDEPCHGLDLINRKWVLDLIDLIGTTSTHLLYVTNHREEIINSITHVLKIHKGKVLAQGRKDEVLTTF